MMKKTLKLALVASAIAASGVVIAACSGGGGDDDDDGGSDPVLLKSNGSPANLGCNGSYTDPVGTGSNLTFNIHVVSQEPTSAPPASGTRVVQFNTATGNTTGTAVVTDANGRAQMTLDPATRYDFLLTKGDGSTHVQTFNFQELTPTVATVGTVDMIVVSKAIVTVVTGVLSIPPSDIVGKAQVAAAITDCDGTALQNATIEIPGAGGAGVAKRCGETDHGYPCVAYFAGSTPTTAALRTDVSGRFAIIGAAPGPITVKAYGVTTAGAPAPTQIGESALNVKADSISLFSTHPL